MHWNHRVIRHKNDMKEPWWSTYPYWFGIHEVFYDDSGNPDSCTVEPIRVVGENLEDIKWQIDKMKEALEKPIIEYEFFEKLESNSNNQLPNE